MYALLGLTESLRSDDHDDLDLSQTRDAEPRWVYDARLGCTANLRRVASTSARPGIPTAGRTANAHPSPTGILLCASVELELNRKPNCDNNNSNDDDTTAAAPNARACASDITRTLALGTSKRF